MKKSVTLVFLAIFTIAMCLVVLHLFPVGEPHLPGYADLAATEMSGPEIPKQADSVALHYNRYSANEVGATSVVGAIILDYRGYDTLYETMVLFTATVAVLAVIGKHEE